MNGEESNACPREMPTTAGIASEHVAQYNITPAMRLSPGLEAVVSHGENLRRRLLTVAGRLDEAGIRYALVGGNAVAHYAGEVSPGAVRTTQAVDFLMEASSTPSPEAALRDLGYSYRHSAGVHMFLDGPRVLDGVHIIIAGEKVPADYLEPAPNLHSIVRASEGFAVIPLAKLVSMKLTSFRDKDRMHLRDMIDVGRLPGDIAKELRPELQQRLQFLLDNPE